MFVNIRLKKSFCIIIIAVLMLSIAAVKIFPEWAQAEEEQGIKVPIIMYHSILKDESLWGDYVLSPVELEKDIIYLKKAGYEAVFVSELIDYAENGGELPEKPVVLTFDDGNYNNLTYLLPLLEKYDFKATVSIVGKYSQVACEEAEPSPVYSYLDWQDISKLADSGRVEIANHSYDMHSLDSRKGVCIMEGESYKQYRQAFYNDIFMTQRLLKENCGITPDVFTYPYGMSCTEARHLVLTCGFKATLGVEEKTNYIRAGEPECLYDLHRYNRPSFVSTEEFMKRVLDG